MTLSNKILPVHIIRLYVWELLKLNTTMTTIKNYIPVVPLEDEPVIADENKAYIVYGYSESGKEPDSQIKSGSVMFRISAPKFSELGQIINVIYSGFGGLRTPEKLNLWSSEYTQGDEKPFIGIRFTTCRSTYVDGGSPDDDEGGPVYGMVQIAYQYVTTVPVVHPTTVSDGLWS